MTNDIYTLVTLGNGDTFDVQESPDRVDADLSVHLESNGTRDYLVHLTSTDGDPIRIKASRIDTVALSTPEGRARAVVIGRERDKEAEQHRAARRGLPDLRRGRAERRRGHRAWPAVPRRLTGVAEPPPPPRRSHRVTRGGFDGWTSGHGSWFGRRRL